MVKYLQVFCTALLFGCQRPEKDLQLLNHFQVIGSHNSYKIGIEPPLMDLLIQEDSNAIGLDYRHLSLPEQLDVGVRALELDVLYDPAGGKFTQPVGLSIMDSLGIPSIPYDTSALIEAGLKVFHIPDIDFRSHCLTFKSCLADVVNWSDAHPDHYPIIITVNPVNEGVEKEGFTSVIPFDKEALDALDDEISEVVSKEQMITPMLVKGEFATLRTAILEKGWPAIEEIKGRLLFVLDAGKEVTAAYLKGNTYQKPMFVNVEEDHPHAGFFIMNDPMAMEEQIRERVKKGFMVRTRSDANTSEARRGDYSRYQAAKRSGAQVISTDYYLKDLSPNKKFQIVFENESYLECNPVFKNINCSL